MTQRTQEQREADDALTEAIQRVCRAYDVIDDDQLVMDYVIPGFALGLDDVGRGTQFFLLYKDDSETGGNTYAHEGLLQEGIRTHIRSRDED